MERALGPITRLQIQRDRLKSEGIGYDPAPILSVDEVSLDAAGLMGRHDDGWVIDVHHRDHPDSRGRGRRPLSIGFVGHYRLMAVRFGRADIGCAGENLIVEFPDRIRLEDLAGEVVVSTADGEVPLRGARVAAPCAEFTSWLKGLDVVVPRSDQADDIAFLDDGTRGYLLDPSHLDRPVTLRIGDLVSVRWSEHG